MKISKLFLTFSLVLGVSITNVIYAQTVILEEQETNPQDSVYKQPQIQYPFELQVVDSRDGKQFKIKIEDPKLIEQRLKSIENIMPMVYLFKLDLIYISAVVKAIAVNVHPITRK